MLAASKPVSAVNLERLKRRRFEGSASEPTAYCCWSAELELPLLRLLHRARLWLSTGRSNELALCPFGDFTFVVGQHQYRLPYYKLINLRGLELAGSALLLC